MIVTLEVKSGIGKQICEDTAIVNNVVYNNDLFAGKTDGISIIGVADGVGGNNGGKEASSFIAENLSQTIFEGETIEIREKILSLNKLLVEYALNQADKKQMATTLTAIVSSDRKYYLIHIGNTRMYVGQGKYLKQLTTDHTTYQWLLSQGQIDSANACNKNEILACFGGGNNNLIQNIEIREIFSDGIPNVFLFTSDGIHEYVDLDRMEELLFSKIDDTEIVKAIIQEAEHNGSTDDKTLIIVRK